MSTGAGHLAHGLVSRTRVALVGIALGQALAWAIAAGLVAAVLIKALQPWLGLPSSYYVVLPVLAALGMGLWRLWRTRNVISLPRVALWIEERIPTLRYALVTLVDPHHAQATQATALGAAVRAVQARPLLLRAARHAVVRALPALALALLAWMALSQGWLPTRLANILPMTRSAAGEVAPPVNRLMALQAELTPPAYTGWPVESLEDPDSIQGLVHSQVRLSGTGTPEGIDARLGEQAIPVEADNDRWALSFSLPAEPAVLTLADGDFRRLVVLEPRADEVPTVVLEQPAADQTVAAAPATLVLEAALSDDVGLAKAHIEYIVSSGESEGNYSSRSGTLHARPFPRGTRTAPLRASVSLAPFKLGPGDQLSLRVVASDGNTQGGPGVGYSETRVLRIARPQDTAQVLIPPAPPSFDKSMMSLRMLIRATERLEQRRPGMTREAFVQEAQPLAPQATDIRQKVQAIIDEIGQGGAFDVPKLLEEALQALWEGERALAVAETGEALPPLRRAHAALKQLNDGAKYYFRGQALPALVNVDEVRMTGTEPVRARGRQARAEAPDPSRELAGAYAEAVRQLPEHPDAAIEALTLLRVRALRDLPALAPALEEALRALRAEQDPAPALRQARRVLEGEPRQQLGLSHWSPLP